MTNQVEAQEGEPLDLWTLRDSWTLAHVPPTQRRHPKRRRQSCLQENIPVPSGLIPRWHKCSSEDEERTSPFAIRMGALPGAQESRST